MLRITRIDEGLQTLRLRLEGKIVGDWVPVLEDELSRCARARRLVLDLAQVDFASTPAIQVLRAARARGAELQGVSPLVSSLIESLEP